MREQLPDPANLNQFRPPRPDVVCHPQRAILQSHSCGCNNAALHRSQIRKPGGGGRHAGEAPQVVMECSLVQRLRFCIRELNNAKRIDGAPPRQGPELEYASRT